MHSNEQIIRDFVAAWSRRDADELCAYFTEDGVYHNMPIGPVAGRSQLRTFIMAFPKNWTATEWDIQAAGRDRPVRAHLHRFPADLPQTARRIARA